MRLWKWRRRGSLQLEASIKRIPPPESAAETPEGRHVKFIRGRQGADSPGVLISNYDTDSRIMRVSNQGEGPSTELAGPVLLISLVRLFYFYLLFHLRALLLNQWLILFTKANLADGPCKRREVVGGKTNCIKAKTIIIIAIALVK